MRGGEGRGGEGRGGEGRGGERRGRGRGRGGEGRGGEREREERGGEGRGEEVDNTMHVYQKCNACITHYQVSFCQYCTLRLPFSPRIAIFKYTHLH